MTELDALIERARGATVARAEAERYVRELDRWARKARPPRRWGPWLVAGVAAAAAAVVAVAWWRGGAAIAPGTPVRVGGHVAIVAVPGTAYRVVRSDASATEIAVEHGAVTARLWRSARPYRLVLAGGGVTATATGTVYSLAVGAGGPVASVIEGAVEVRAADGTHVVHAGEIWPPAGRAVDPEAARVLLALAAPEPVPVVEQAGASPASGAAPEAASDAGAPPSPRPTGAVHDAAVGIPRASPATPAIKDRWHTARLLRGQGRFGDAVAECLAIAGARDPTWSPIALVEAVRIELGPLADPGRAIALADRAIREWPSDALVAEARALRCRALGQLGRGDECAPASRP